MTYQPLQEDYEGTISAYYGLQAGHITSSQFSILVGVVITTAIIPTFIAQQWFSPAQGFRGRNGMFPP